jgi:uncharacterized protein (DUF305 family)
MNTANSRRFAIGLSVLALSAGCQRAMDPPATPAAQPQPVAAVEPAPPAMSEMPAMEPESDRPEIFYYGRHPYTKADVDFMAGMIPHHAQALIMAGMAASHGAREDVRILCERIIVAQGDEIALMRGWLRDRGEFVPEPDATHHMMQMGGEEHAMLMPGMLSEEEMTALDAARGPEWDRLFLIGMIKHHQGAVDMVNELWASYGAAQGDVVFQFSSDVLTDQTIEIDFMTKMLERGGVLR